MKKNLESGVYREITFRTTDEIGRFQLNTHSLMDMSIFVEPAHRGKSIARRMIGGMMAIMADEGSLDPNAFVYIDTDASQGFWHHLGLTPNPNVDDTTKPEYGYEKRISMEKLQMASRPHDCCIQHSLN